MTRMPVEMRDPETYAIIGACLEVHRHLGPGFLEAVYHEALEREFVRLGIPYRRQVEIAIHYKGEALACTYRADFVCYNDIIVELKAIKQLTGVDRAQTINYLRATGLHRALLINFGAPSLEYERIVN